MSCTNNNIYAVSQQNNKTLKQKNLKNQPGDRHKHAVAKHDVGLG